MRRTALASQSPRFQSQGLGVIDPLFLTVDSVPASVGGWDTLSPIAAMPPDHALVLDNWIPRPGFLEIRRGTQSWATGLGTSFVETIMPYNAANTTNDKLYAAANNNIYDITSGGAGSSVVSGQSNNRYQYLNFSDNAGNHYLLAVNGADTPQIYNGTSWSTWSVTGVSGVPIAVAQHKGRLWIVPIASTTMYYVNPAGSASGAATAFQIGPFMSKGGFVSAIATWSIDVRQTVDEYLAFITSRGQVIVYEGTDPSSPSTWDLVGIYDIGAPIGRRCYLRVAGDLFIICVDGIVPMSQMLSTDRTAANRVSLTAQIMDTMRQSAQLYGGNYGWQFIGYPRGTMGILNVPVVEDQTSIQYVMNTLTGAWCRFLGINCNCWETFHDIAYIGRNDGTVYKFDTDSADGTTPIVATVNTAFNYFKSRGRRKKFNSVRPIITTDHSVTPAVGINVDFNTSGTANPVSSVVATSAQWDVAQWDQAVWPQNSNVVTQWQSLTGEGFCASIIVQASTSKSGNANGVTLQLNGFDINMEPGGPL